MSDFVLIEQHTMTVMEVAADKRTHSLQAAADLTDVHPDLIRHYCRSGLLGETRMKEGADPDFDDDALYEIRRIEHYRQQHGVNLRALPLVLGLLREIEILRSELRFLRKA